MKAVQAGPEYHIKIPVPWVMSRLHDKLSCIRIAHCLSTACMRGYQIYQIHN
jgi:hypothetical protein